MADKLVVDCSTGEESAEPLTPDEQTDRNQTATDAAAAATQTRDRQARRQQAIDRLNTFTAMDAGATAAQVRTESQFVAKVLARVLPFIDVDPA